MSATNTDDYAALKAQQHAVLLLEEHLGGRFQQPCIRYVDNVPDRPQRVTQADRPPQSFFDAFEDSDDYIYNLFERFRLHGWNDVKLQKPLKALKSGVAFRALCHEWTFSVCTIQAMHGDIATPEVIGNLKKLLSDFWTFCSLVPSTYRVAGVKLVIGDDLYGIAWEAGYNLEQFVRAYPVFNEAGVINHARFKTHTVSFLRLLTSVANVHLTLKRGHQDLRPTNILVKLVEPSWPTPEFMTTGWVLRDDEYTARISTFQEEMRQFAAPEVERAKSPVEASQSVSTDVFSLGAIGLALYLGQLPRRATSVLSPDACVFELLSATASETGEWQRVSAILARMTTVSPSRRISLATACGEFQSLAEGWKTTYEI